MLARSDTDLAGLLELALTSPSPTESLRAIAGLREELAELERLHVTRALEAGASFSELARMLGISRQAAHRRYRWVVAPAPVVGLDQPQTITREARAAIEFALDEAGSRGTAVVDSEHLLVGIVATADHATAQALAALGVTVGALRGRPRRPAAAAEHGGGRSLRAALIAAATLDLDLLVGATLEARDGRAREALEDLAVPPRAFRAAVGRHRF